MVAVPNLGVDEEFRGTHSPLKPNQPEIGRLYPSGSGFVEINETSTGRWSCCIVNMFGRLLRWLQKPSSTTNYTAIYADRLRSFTGRHRSQLYRQGLRPKTTTTAFFGPSANLYHENANTSPSNLYGAQRGLQGAYVGAVPLNPYLEKLHSLWPILTVEVGPWLKPTLQPLNREVSPSRATRCGLTPT